MTHRTPNSTMRGNGSTILAPYENRPSAGTARAERALGALL
jgi:hypothetical protein